MSHDDYKPLTTTEHMERCPVCGGAVSLWQYSTSETAPTTKTVMCDTRDPIGPQDGMVNEGCPLYMPGDDFYRATVRDALRYWNEFAKALTALQRKNRWEHAQVLRAPTPKEPG